MVVDVLHLDGRSVRDLPYSQRREILEAMALDGRTWKTPKAFFGQVTALARATEEQGLEPIVVKRLALTEAAGGSLDRRGPGRAGKRPRAAEA